MLACSSFAHAQNKKEPLKWGMDATGGAPYIFDNNTKGFEVELAAYIAKELGRVSEPFNGDWSKLPELLKNQAIHIVLNGYEYSDQFTKQASIPYYIYRLTAVVNAKNDTIRSWEDLRVSKDGKKKRVGVLTGSAAERYMSGEFGDDIELLEYEDVANTYQLVANGGLDASVQDNPAATYYLTEDAAKAKSLRRIPDSRSQGFYVILTREEDTQLRQDVNAALRKCIEDGTLEKILRKYGIWTEDQERLLHRRTKSWDDVAAEEAVAPTAPINWTLALKLLLYAAGMTVLLAVVAMPLATIIGLIVAELRLYGPRWLSYLLTIYVEVLRGTPLLLQLWVLYYLLPDLLPAYREFSKQTELIGILGLALNYSASQAEHFRGAFQNLPRGQSEAALSLGMTKWTVIRRILAPQAIRSAIPSVTNDFVAMFKDTAVCSVIAVRELTKQYNTLYNNHRDNILELAAITAVLYLLMSYPLSIVARVIERKTKSTT